MTVLACDFCRGEAPLRLFVRELPRHQERNLCQLCALSPPAYECAFSEHVFPHTQTLAHLSFVGNALLYRQGLHFEEEGFRWILAPEEKGEEK